MIEYDQWGDITRFYYLTFDASNLSRYNDYEYDESGKLLKVTYGQSDGTSYGYEYTYDENGNCIREICINTNGSITEFLYEYDEAGRRVRQTKTNADGTTVEYIYEYDGQGNVVREECSDGSVIEYQNEYDSQGRITSAVASDGTVYEYNEDGSYRVTYPSGEIHEYYSSGVLHREFTAIDSIITYNERGYIISNAHPNNNQEDVWEYSESGALMRQYNYVNGLVVTFEYDEEGYLLKVSSDWTGESTIDTIYEYDREGNLITEIMETDGVLFGRREYREDGTLSKSVSSDRYSIHNQDGNVQKEVFNDGRCNLYRYDENGMLLVELAYGEDGSYQYCGYDYSSDTDALEVFWGKDYVACLYYDMYLEPAYAVIYEYDEDGSMISYSTVTPEEFEAYRESRK